MTHVYESFVEILDNITIKYSYLAEENETNVSKQVADMYLDAYNHMDTFDTYIDYTKSEYLAAGLTNSDIIDEAMRGNTSIVPTRYRNTLLEIRRKRVLDTFEETNNYYRMLDGYPDTNDNKYFYIDEKTANSIGMPNRVAIHLIQDYYNKQSEGLGDTYIHALEGLGYIDALYKANPDKTYLKYIGSNRIPIYKSRPAKNFQILQLKHGNIKNITYNEFVQLYSQSRDYFMNVIYIRTFRTFIDNYDRFIAMAIMVMTIQQLVIKQVDLTINREFFDIYAVRMLYQAYGIPYNLNLDEETQNRLVQNLNLFIQNKATNKGLYDIAEALGFGSNFNIYKYYLSKEHKLDAYGVPIFGTTQRFNNDTGEMETVPDYEYMYNVYFHRANLNDDKFSETFNSAINSETYLDVVNSDPFWWQDTNLYDRVWETEYNFVESKYLGLSISYKLTDILFENILLLKTIIKKQDELDGLTITLPKILGSVEIPIFDVIILLISLTSCKHNLTGEIISIPNQVLSVIDYLANTEGGEEYLVDTFSFNFDYYLEPHYEKSTWLNKQALKVVSDDIPDEDFDSSKMIKISIAKKDVENIKEGQYVINILTRLYQLLPENEAKQIQKYLSILSINSNYTDEEKIATFNEMYNNLKSLYKFIEALMTATSSREVYERLHRLYRTAFYSKEVKSVFTITTESHGITRTAYNFFEYLYYKNPLLYDTIFDFSPEAQYEKYLQDNNLLSTEYTYDQFVEDYENGDIKVHYDILRDGEVNNVSVKDEKIYFYINHIVSRLELFIENISTLYMLGDVITPLEELLVKLIIFFKSYTVDLISLDNIYVANIKPENDFKLFDELTYMEKLILTKDYMKMAYSDVLHLIMSIHIKDDLKFYERYIKIITLLIDEKHGITNSVRLREYPEYMEKLIQILERALRLYDTVPEYSVEISPSDSFGLRDKALLYYEVIQVYIYITKEFELNSVMLKEEPRYMEKLNFIKEKINMLHDNIHQYDSNIASKDGSKLHDDILIYYS